MTRFAVLLVVLAGCAGNAAQSAMTSKPVLWQCTCTMTDSAGATSMIGTGPDNMLCSTSDPANMLEELYKGVTCEPCKATASACEK